MITSISGRELRDKLFRKSKPQFRHYQQSDNGILWAAYKRGSFDLPEGMVEAEFLEAMARKWSHPLIWVVEDDNAGFKAGRGPVAIVGIKTDGWVYEPSVSFFKWASRRNVLRSAVAFFHMMRNAKYVGVCLARVMKRDFAFLKHMEKYRLMYLRGRIPKGSPQGEVFVFSIDGGK